MSRKLLLILVCALSTQAVCSAITITEFAFTAGKVTTSGPINLTLEDIAISNPAVPLDVADVKIDTSGWSADGDPVIVDPIVVSGFDVPSDEIKITLDCNRFQQSIGGFPTALTYCNVLSIGVTGFPSLLATPIDIDISSIVMSEQGTLVDTFGSASVPFLASASGTGSKVFPVSEPNGGSMISIFFSALAMFGLVRSYLQ